MDALQQRAGNRVSGLLLQRKLRVGAPNDRYELEADRIAGMVVDSPTHARPMNRAPREPLLQRCACGGTCASCAHEEEEQQSVAVQRLAISPVPSAYLQREATESCNIKEEGEDEEEKAEETEEAEAAAKEEEEQQKAAEATVQPKRRTGEPASVPNEVESRLAATRGGGSALPANTRHRMESRFGYDFSRVRIHTGDAARGLNHDLNALAFTTGSDIYFAPGQFEPTSRRGQRLLAHELTHVVQQAGGSEGVVREKADPDLISRAADDEASGGKYYYYTVVISGQRAHARIERILRDSDSNLVTEAAIPGANRYMQDLNLVGVADLYKSVPDKTVSGVKAYNPVAAPRDVVAMNDPKKVKTLPGVTSSPKIGGKRDDATRPWSGNFPEHIWLGEIKPLTTTKVGAGLFQLDSYEQGYKAFVARMNQISGGKTRASLQVSRLEIPIPAFLNFDNWNSQHNIPNDRSTLGTRRLWVAHIGSGLYVYFHLSNSPDEPHSGWEADQIRQMREVRAELGGGKHPRTARMDPFVSGKFLPGGPRLPVERKVDAGRPPRLIQRNTKDRPPNYWPDQAKKWEEKRSKWGTGFRTTFKTKYKALSEKIKVEKRLGKTSRAAPAAEQAELRNYKQLLFWSGIPGKFIGKVRFLLGGVWDKILGVFEDKKKKMHDMRTRTNAMSHESWGLGGWRKTLIKIVMQVAKQTVIRFITDSFNFFVECFHSAMDKVWVKIQGELTEKFAVELCAARKFFEKSKDELENQWGVSLADLAKLLKTIGTIKTWTDIATASIQLIRLGVQVISCLTPPALGCLWGLVAQIGISAGLDLLIGTQWFNDRIVNPAVRDLVRTYATPLYQKLINRALGEELKEYHCHIADNQFPQLDAAEVGGLPLGSDLLKHRDQWETRNRETILKDLKDVFQKGKGRRVSTEELEQLAAELKKSGKKPEELKALLEASRDAATGRLKIEEATSNVQTGVIPQVPGKGEGEGDGEGKERKIDYPRATKRNKQLQRELRWDPLTFYKKPGVAVDSEEFADAVYDMQEALRISADGILGEQTLIAFYERNKVKPDAAYEAAVKLRAEKREAKEKAAREKAEKAAKAKAAPEGTTQGGGDVVAIGIAKPTSGLIEDRYPNEYWAYSGGWLTIPIGEVKDIQPGDATAPGQLITISVRFFLKGQYVWFTDIPATFTYWTSMNKRPWLRFKTDSTYYFKIRADAPESYHYVQGDHVIELQSDVPSPYE